jgi:hypothetical protein
VALAAGLSQASSSVSAGSATEAVDVAATFAVVREKLNLTHFNGDFQAALHPVRVAPVESGSSVSSWDHSSGVAVVSGERITHWSQPTAPTIPLD